MRAAFGPHSPPHEEFCKDFAPASVYLSGRRGSPGLGSEDTMCFGKNIKRAGVWVLAFVIAQGMVYRWGYDVGYLYGTRQGYGDFFQEKHSQARSAEAFAADATQAPAAAGDALVAARETSGQ
jgi:hypothetical protein